MPTMIDASKHYEYDFDGVVLWAYIVFTMHLTGMHLNKWLTHLK